MNTAQLKDETVLLTPDEVADKLRIKPRTLQVWRINGKGPRAMRYGNVVRYRPSDVSEWIDQHVEDVPRSGP